MALDIHVSVIVDQQKIFGKMDITGHFGDSTRVVPKVAGLVYKETQHNNID